jgi:hypothetical protein
MVAAVAFKNLQQPLGFRTGFVAAKIWPVASHAKNERFWNSLESSACGQSVPVQTPNE